MLLSDWSSDSAKDIIDRNRSHRLKQRAQKKVRFILPSLALDVIGGKRVRTEAVAPSLPSSSFSSSLSSSGDLSVDFKGEEEGERGRGEKGEVEEAEERRRDSVRVFKSDRFEVTEWLNSIHLGRYSDVFHQHGFVHIEQVQAISSMDLDTMSIKVPRHRALILKESSSLM